MKALLVLLLTLVAAPTWSQSSLETSGDITHLLLPTVAMGATLWVEDDYEGSWQLIQAAVTSRLVVEGLKYGVEKERPDGSGDDSFPSGHTSDSFMAATFINQRYGWEYGIPAYIAASYVGYTRVASDKHYLGDVLAGAAIGAFTGWYFTQPYENVTLTPIAGNGVYGLSVSGRF